MQLTSIVKKKDLPPNKLDWLNDLHARLMMAAEDQDNFLIILQEIVDNDLLNKALNQHTQRHMLSFLVNNPPDWLYRYSSLHTHELVSAIFSIVEGLSISSFEHQTRKAESLNISWTSTKTTSIISSMKSTTHSWPKFWIISLKYGLARRL